MKILLVYADEIAKNYEIKRPPLGISYLGTVLSNSHTVKILDMRLQTNDIQKFKDTLESFQPDFVGFSLIALGIEQTFQLVKIVKNNTHAKIILGGPEITLSPSKYLKKEGIDFILRGEGEYTFLNLLDNLENKKDYSTIKGLGFKKEGKLFINPYDFIEDLDKLPFPEWDLFELDKYRKSPDKIKFPIMTSRGCPFCCSFCDSTIINGKYRVRTAKNVVDEMEAIHDKYHNTNFQIMDDNFAVFPQRVNEICDEILKRNLKFTWVVGQGFSPPSASYELFQKMKKAGCIVIYFGIESADDEVLRAIRKPFTVEQAKQAIKWAKQAKLIVKAPFISGLPKSTYEKEKKYIDFFKETKIDMPKMLQIIPFPGTDIYEWVKNHTKPLMNIEKMHTTASQTRGSLDTDLFKPVFETEEFPLKDRIKIMKEFQEESEKYILINYFGKFFGRILFYPSRIKFFRKWGVKLLDIYYDQF
jgi:anaerobic magnesium-protoporphyrin IX monomethyl ester cyclase